MGGYCNKNNIKYLQVTFPHPEGFLFKKGIFHIAVYIVKKTINIGIEHG